MSQFSEGIRSLENYHEKIRWIVCCFESQNTFLLGALLSLGVFGIFAWHSSAQKQDSDELSGHTGTVLAAPLATIDVTEPTDAIVGVAATLGSATSNASTVGTVAGANNYPAAESPASAIDNSNGPGSKYLNFAKTGVGFIVTSPAHGPQTVVTGLHFFTANDAPERDPLTVTIEGTNSANATTTLNSTWTAIYNGVTGLSTDPGRNSAGPAVSFSNTLAFSSYRVLVSSVRNTGTANSVQIGEIELLSIIDTAPPTASANPLGVTTGGGTSYSFPVTYMDDVAINVSTIDTGDVRITGPNGFNVSPLTSALNNNANGTPRIATYTFTPPGGSWDTGDNGTYNVVMQASQVADTSGNFVAAGNIGSFSVNIPDTIVPTATPAIAANVTIAGGTAHPVSVQYNDNLAINVGSVGNGDISITGPSGFNTTPSFVNATFTSATLVNGNYTFTPPGGSWDFADNGTYNVVMQASQVADLSGNFVAAGNIGSFTVNIPATATHFGVTAPANATSGTPFNFTVNALDASNAIVPGYRGTVHFTSTDGGATLPIDYNFIVGDGGVHTFSTTLVTAGNQTITATDFANSINGISGPITVTGSIPTTATVSGKVFTASGGGLGGATVSITDPQGNRLTVRTNNFGSYTFNSVATGQSYIVSVASKRFRFANQNLPVNGDLANINFTGLE